MGIGADMLDSHIDKLPIQSNNKPINGKTMKTIKHIKGNGDFTNDYGTFYSFEYEFTDGSIFLANHKTATSPYKEGDNVDIEGKGTTKDGVPYGKISKQQQSNYNGYKKPGQGSTASFALSYAKDLVIGDKVKIEDLLPTATKMNNWLKENS